MASLEEWIGQCAAIGDRAANPSLHPPGPEWTVGELSDRISRLPTKHLVELEDVYGRYLYRQPRKVQDLYRKQSACIVAAYNKLHILNAKIMTRDGYSGATKLSRWLAREASPDIVQALKCFKAVDHNWTRELPVVLKCLRVACDFFRLLAIISNPPSHLIEDEYIISFSGDYFAEIEQKGASFFRPRQLRKPKDLKPAHTMADVLKKPSEISEADMPHPLNRMPPVLLPLRYVYGRSVVENDCYFRDSDSFYHFVDSWHSPGG